ncbi:MAG: hypothetical protein JNJ84_09875 [Rhodobacteraceae bacterium]|nr:hypothetical protein [Paracoccaceae bacterium]
MCHADYRFKRANGQPVPIDLAFVIAIFKASMFHLVGDHLDEALDIKRWLALNMVFVIHGPDRPQV